MSAFGRAYAAVFDRLAAREDRRGSIELRRRVVASATGDVLEIGAGTGRCLPLYRDATRVTALEPDADLRRWACRRAANARVPVDVVDGRAESLAFEDGTFDTVVTAWVLCTVADPDAALAGIRRVLRTGGTYRFVEHVRADDRRLARRQDRLATPWRWIARGCRCNQDTAALLSRAGFDIGDTERFVFEPTSPTIVRPTLLGHARVVAS